VKLLTSTLWNSDSYRQIEKLIADHKPEVAHFNNTFPLISPAAFHACKKHGVATVWSLRNYRLICPSAIFHRDHHICEECLGKTIQWPGVLHKCYRGSAVQSAVVAMLNATHTAIGTWKNKIDVFVTLAEATKEKFVQAGLPSDKIVVKPNFVTPDPGIGPGDGGYAIFVGRLNPEKGLGTLLKAWETLGKEIPIKILGEGVERENVEATAKKFTGIEYVGRVKVQETYELMGRAKMLVLPSEWYEPFGRVAVEAFAKGTPVLASRLGALTELVEPGRTGELFEPGDAGSMIAGVRKILSNPNYEQMRNDARAEYVARYTAPQNAKYLEAIYARAIASSKE